MFLILCQVNNSLQGRGKLKCVRQILRHFRCLWRRKTKYSRRGSQEGCRDWGLLDYLLFSHLPFYASLPLANSGIIYCWQATQRVCFEWKQYFRNRKDYEQIKTLTNKTWKPKHKNTKKLKTQNLEAHLANVSSTEDRTFQSSWIKTLGDKQQQTKTCIPP